MDPTPVSPPSIIETSNQGIEDIPVLDLLKLADALAEAARKDAHKAGRAVSCRGSGCNHCCRGLVHASEAEAALIRPLVSPDQMAAIKTLLASGKELKWAPCPLLAKDGSCSVYAQRPAVCRSHQSLSPPSVCNSKLNPKRHPKLILPNQMIHLIRDGQERGVVKPLVTWLGMA